MIGLSKKKMQKLQICFHSSTCTFSVYNVVGTSIKKKKLY